MCFPSFPGFGGGTFQRAQDKELALLCIKAWNDFYIDEWCATAPDRYVPLAILPMWDIDASVAEADASPRRARAPVSFPDSPVPLGLPSFHSDHWDRCGRSARRPRCRCRCTSVPAPSCPASRSPRSSRSRVRWPCPTRPFAVAIALFSTNLMWTTVDLLFSGKLQQFPDLKFSLAEGGIGWIPYILERTDYVWERHRYYQKIDFDTRPSESVPQALLGLLHRRRVRAEEPARDRRRPHHARDRLPALATRSGRTRASGRPRCSPTCPTTNAR